MFGAVFPIAIEMPKDVGADRHRLIMRGRHVGARKDDIESVGRREVHIGAAERRIETRIDGSLEPVLIPTRERSDIGEEKAGVEEIGRVAYQPRESELIRN